MEGPDGTVHHNAHAPSSSGATAGRGSKNMKLAQLEGPPCLPHACSSVPCCGGWSAPGRPSGSRPARPRWSPSARRRRLGHRADLLRVRPPLRARRGGGAGPGQRGELRGVDRRRDGLAGAGERLPAQRDPYPGRRRPRPAGETDLRLVPGDHPARHHPQAAAGRARRVRPAADGRPRSRPPGPTCWCCSATRSTPTSPRRRCRRLLQAAPAAAGERPGRPGGQLRRVHQALPGVLARPGDPLAALHRAERDDLRRPRDHRRLEHLGVLAGGHARAALVGRADRAAGSPRTGSTSTWATSPRTRSPPTRSTPRWSPPRTPPTCCASSASGSTRRPTWRTTPNAGGPCSTSGATPSIWAGPAWSCWTTGAAGCSNRAPGRCCRPASGPGSWTGRTASTTTWWSARRCPGCCRRASTTSRRGTSASPTRAGPGWPRLAEQIRRALDLEHWAAFRRSFDALGELFARIGSGTPGAPGDRVGAGPAYAPPASISVLSGDVHHSYVARARFDDPAVRTPVHQLTCSPIHNQVPAAMRR